MPTPFKPSSLSRSLLRVAPILLAAPPFACGRAGLQGKEVQVAETAPAAPRVPISSLTGQASAAPQAQEATASGAAPTAAAQPASTPPPAPAAAAAAAPDTAPGTPSLAGTNVLEMAAFPEQLSPHEVAISFLGARGHLFWFDRTTALTDPGRLEPAVLPGRANEAMAAKEALSKVPALSLVVLSKNDNESLDGAMAKALWQRFHPTFMVPKGGKDRLVGFGVPAKAIAERGAWQSAQLDHSRFVATFVPTEAAQKGQGKNNVSMGVVFGRAGHHVLFAARGSVGEHMQQIHRHFGHPAVSVLPVAHPAPGAAPEPGAAAEPKGALAPHEAVMVQRTLGSAVAVGSQATSTPAATPAPKQLLGKAAHLREAQALHGVPQACFVSPQPFRTLRIDMNSPGPCHPDGFVPPAHHPAIDDPAAAEAVHP